VEEGVGVGVELELEKVAEAEKRVGMAPGIYRDIQ
jgi:hypothetical protein